tara:strand:- start:1020 stop:1184 length:165 start_codon:yes stop_codon:yes gene_type:complete
MSKYTDRLLTAVQEIADIIYFGYDQFEMDEWLHRVIALGLYEVPEDEGSMHGYQ